MYHYLTALSGMLIGYGLFQITTVWLKGSVKLPKNTHHLGSIIIPTYRKNSQGDRISLHVHHWLYLTLIGALIHMGNPSFNGLLGITKGFCVGGVVQGLTFSNWHEIQISDKNIPLDPQNILDFRKSS